MAKLNGTTIRSKGKTTAKLINKPTTSIGNNTTKKTGTAKAKTGNKRAKPTIKQAMPITIFL